MKARVNRSRVNRPSFFRPPLASTEVTATPRGRCLEGHAHVGDSVEKVTIVGDVGRARYCVGGSGWSHLLIRQVFRLEDSGGR